MASSLEITNCMYDCEVYFDMIREKLINESYLNDQLEIGVECGMGNTYAAIGPDGCIYPCHMLMHPSYKGLSVLDHGIEYAWRHSDSISRAKQATIDNCNECHTCEFFTLCSGGCRGVAFARTGDIRGFIGLDACIKYKYEFSKRIRAQKK
ncbi:hypothetical protein CSA37_07625 [Candidatus Fermentibacteria bacterium]|nr:MAG: hypothetical protein CSA37_07625 [Candidatus Fermentibacteria bacterium]